MKSLPTISFVIPTFNRASILPRAIDSLLHQTSSNWQLIVVDDGSSDHTADVMEFFQEDERITLIQQEHQGVSVARNSGAEMAAGDYIIFLDSDDSLDPELLHHLNESKFWKYDLIFWEVWKKFEERNELWKPRDLGKIYNNIKGSFLAGSICYKKNIFMEAGKYDPAISFGENYELGMRVCRKTNLNVHYIDKPLLWYFVDGQDRVKKFPERLDSNLYQYEKHKELYLAHPAANAEMLRIIGFMFEQLNNRSRATKYYLESLSAYPWQVKLLLRIFYLNIFK